MKLSYGAKSYLAYFGVPLCLALGAGVGVAAAVYGYPSITFVFIALALGSAWLAIYYAGKDAKERIRKAREDK